MRGYADQAREDSQALLTYAESLSSPYQISFASAVAAILSQYLRDSTAMRVYTKRLIALATEQKFPFFVAFGRILHGWGEADQGQAQQGIAQIRDGLDAWQAMETRLIQPYWLGLLADACDKQGRPEEGLSILAEALTDATARGEQVYAAELYRLKGELILNDERGMMNDERRITHAAEAESCFQQAIAVAQQQGAKSLELRAVMSLSSLWHRQGKTDQACQQLADIYSWFTEGFDTADLTQAKALLDD